MGFARVIACAVCLCALAGCSSTVDGVPPENRTAHVERIEVRHEPNEVEVGGLFLDAYKTFKKK